MKELQSLEKEIKRLTEPSIGLTGFFDAIMGTNKSSNFPKYNKYKEDNYTVFEFALAGWDIRDIRVLESRDKIKIEGSMEIENTRIYSHKDLAYRNFERIMYKSPEVHTIKAVYKNGLLKIYFEELVAPEYKEVEIQVE